MLLIDDNDVIQEVKFTGSGCAISVASASMMTDEIIGKKVQEVEKIIEEVLGTMRGENEVESLDEHGDLVALKGVIKFPVRVKCATLAWHAVKDGLKKNKKERE